MKKTQIRSACIVILILLFAPVIKVSSQDYQKLRLGLHADPSVCWFGSDTKETANDGARPGFAFGLTLNRYFAQNYSFSTGINIINAGGRLVSTDTVKMEFNNLTSTVMPGKPVIYRIQYLSVPIGLKLESNQIGYLTFFSDIGLDPKIVIGGQADIPSNNIEKEKAANELRDFNLSYHITAGIEYSMGGTTELVFGLGFDNNFLDITKENGEQPIDKITHKILSFRFGVNF